MCPVDNGMCDIDNAMCNAMQLSVATLVNLETLGNFGNVSPQFLMEIRWMHKKKMSHCLINICHIVMNDIPNEWK